MLFGLNGSITPEPSAPAPLAPALSSRLTELHAARVAASAAIESAFAMRDMIFPFWGDQINNY
jgi:hypothetical protein